MAYSFFHLDYTLLSLILFTVFLTFFHCIVNLFRGWSYQQCCLHTNMYLATFVWHSYKNFLLLFHLVLIFTALCKKLLTSMPPHIPVYLSWAKLMKEYLLGRQSLAVLYSIHCGVFFVCFSLKTMYLKTRGKKGYT